MSLESSKYEIFIILKYLITFIFFDSKTLSSKFIFFSNIEAENVSNGGWGQSGREDDDSSDSSDDSSVELEESPPNHNEISIQQLINSSDEESQPTSKHSRSLTCPDIYSK